MSADEHPLVDACQSIVFCTPVVKYASLSIPGGLTVTSKVSSILISKVLGLTGTAAISTGLAVVGSGPSVSKS